jgi:hypothetical protein
MFRADRGAVLPPLGQVSRPAGAKPGEFMAERHLHDREVPRRVVLGASAALGASAWLLHGTVGADSALAVGPRPPALPGGLEPYQTRYRNWVGEIHLDDPAWSGVPGARPPLLSPVRPRADRPEWDTALWLDILTMPGTPHLHRFLRDVERFLWRTFDGTRAALRVEWSKGWAYTDDAAWADQEVIDRRVPDSLRAGGGEGWDEAVAVLDRHDPHRIFGTAFLDSLLS